MSEVPAFLKVSSADIAAKVIEGEAVIINLATGVYYSTDGVGATIWSMIEERGSVAGIAESLPELYDVRAEQSRQDVEAFARQLLQEDLVAAAPEPAGGGPTTGVRVMEGQPYVTPELKIYRDMGDLLALDPPIPGLEQIPWEDPATGTSSTQN